MWCLPGKVGADFIWRMEAVLDLYAEPYDPKHPVVCVDERPCALRADVRPSLPCTPGQVRREDYEYERLGGCTVFLAFQPLGGWRHGTVSWERKKANFAEVIRELADVHFPEAETIRLVVDNLTTHTPAAFYDTFGAEEGRRLRQKVAFHYTPKHASWLNMVEIELSILVKQCLRRRIGSMETLAREVAAWERQRNAQHATVDWRFDVPAARTKLARFYP